MAGRLGPQAVVCQPLVEDSELVSGNPYARPQIDQPSVNVLPFEAVFLFEAGSRIYPISAEVE